MSDALQGLAPDCLQRALRSRFRQQVKPGVRPHRMHLMTHGFRFGPVIALLVAALSFGDCVAAPPIDVTQWEGLYRSTKNEVLRVRSYGDVISIDIFSGSNEAWTLTTAWATGMTKSDYAEFRQRAEPDGLWLSQSFKKEGALLQVHEPAQPTTPPSFFRRLSQSESKLIVGLPE